MEIETERNEHSGWKDKPPDLPNIDSLRKPETMPMTDDQSADSKDTGRTLQLRNRTVHFNK